MIPVKHADTPHLPIQLVGAALSLYTAERMHKRGDRGRAVHGDERAGLRRRRPLPRAALPRRREVRSGAPSNSASSPPPGLGRFSKPASAGQPPPIQPSPVRHVQIRSMRHHQSPWF